MENEKDEVLLNKIIEVINEHINLADTDVYHLTRTKTAFAYGTVTIDDFVEWDEDAVFELAESIVQELQPKLNENQEAVLKWLKEQKSEHVVTPFVLFHQLTSRHSLITTSEVLEAFDDLSESEEIELLQVFTNWLSTK